MAFSAFGQDIEPKFKFGELNPGELEMDVYPNDSDANAVVLCNMRDVRYEFRSDVRIIYENFIRIKVLKDEGRGSANVEIAYNNKPGGMYPKENILGIKAFSYNLENGKVVKNKMTDDLVFNERINEDIMRTKFTIPQVKVGTVLEYKYTIVSTIFYSLDDWIVQEERPVAFAKYDLIIPEWFQFNVEAHGTQWLKTYNSLMQTSYGYNGELIRANAQHYTTRGYNIPAIKETSFIWNSDDYAAKVISELSYIKWPNEPIKSYTQKWEDIEQLLMKNEDFGKRLYGKNPYYDELVAEKVVDIESTEQRATKTLQILKRHLKWDKTYKLFTKSPSDITKAGTGSNADINMIYINMLHDVGINAVPVVMSTRKHGMLPVTFPSIEYLNTFIVGVEMSPEETKFIDASAENGYFNVLPPELYTDRARVISAAPNWVDLQKIVKASNNMQVNAKVDADGTLSGSVTHVYRGNSSLEKKDDFLEAKDSVTFVKDMGKEHGIEVSEYGIDNVHDFGDKVVEHYTFTKKGEATADHIYINPYPKKPVSENPMVGNSRTMPIELPFMSTDNTTVNITIPDGWTVESMPKPLVISTSNNGISARMLPELTGNTLSIIFTIRVNTLFYSADEFKSLKEFFAHLVEKSNDMIVLKKV